jgi:SNF2 family DNA or RNA helicase
MLYKTQLHQYQLNIIEKASSLKSCALYLSMGLGKTTIALSVVANKKPKRTLIVAPLQVARNVWHKEIENWEHLNHLTYSLVIGTEKQRRQALNQKADIYITNYESIAWLSGLDKFKQFDQIIFDESSRLKSPSTQRFKILKKEVKAKDYNIMLLSGTPSPNEVSDLWSQIGLLDKGARLETSLTRFRDKYMDPDQRNRHTGMIYSYKAKPKAMEEITNKISDIAFSMQAKDYLTLPKEIPIYHEIKLSNDIKGAYDDLKKDLVSELGGQQITAVNAAAAITKLLQVTSGAVYDENREIVPVHSDKIDLLTELLESNDEPVLLFYNFKHSLTRIQEAFPDAQLVTEKSIADWKAGKIKMLIGHPASIGEGLNLQNNIAKMAHVVWFDLFFSSSLYLQGNARIARQGQNVPVIIHHLIAQDTVDEHVVKILTGKIDLQNLILDYLKV